MEGGCLTFTTASAPARPSTCLHNNSSFVKQFHTNSLPVTITRRRGLSVKASTHNFSTAKPTLSRNWDVSSYSKAPSWLPRFEELDTTNMLLRQRIIFLGSQVDDTTADFIISQLLFLDAEDQKKDIRLIINSPGGSVTAGMGIYDAMKLCKADVSTICMGLAASMGAFLLASGSKGKRYCMPNAKVMIHQPLGSSGGKATEMSIQIREMAYHKMKLNKILSRITGKPLEKIEVDTDRDNFLNAWEAKEYGLVDAVIDDGKPGLVAPVTKVMPPPRTRVWDQWKIEGTKKAKKYLPSEERILQNDEQRSNEEKDEAPSPL
ncbi:ATP-dependent Clp protease proteolytic subunit 4 [Datura stramonium]|uniref:ATP-dependent Clp protease proteolytic subunit n=1 Tax=Datura stramonium TaxID=4076 RepID=A0ABS8SC08_DATST|nr:ATP-dependent Clp protease proteolytic subunit 4 [Datura stramonium]